MKKISIRIPVIGSIILFGGVAMKRLVAFLFFLVIVWTLVGCDKKPLEMYPV